MSRHTDLILQEGLTPMLQIESITRRPLLPFSIISVVYDTLGRKPPGKTVIERSA